MLVPSLSNGTEASQTTTLSEYQPSLIYNSTETVPGLSSNRSGRINGPASWSWPWMTNTPISTPTSSSTLRSRTNAFNRIFFGPFERDNGGIPVDPYASYYPAPSPPAPPGPGSNMFGLGRGAPSDNHYNYVYKYNPKTQSATDLEQHTTTTIYIICICLIIMLVGTILFAFVSKCQENAGRTAAASSNPTGRRRRRRSTTTTNNNNNNNTSPNSRNRPEISIIMPGDGDENGAPPAYPKVIFDPPPSYDSLFPVKE